VLKTFFEDDDEDEYEDEYEDDDQEVIPSVLDAQKTLSLR